MRIVVDMNHPAHVHYFKNFIYEMRKRGHIILITASEKDITFKLLESYHLDFTNVGNYGKSAVTKLINIPIIDLKYYRLVKAFNPDVLIGFGSIRAAHASFLLKKPCINFEDTEHSTEQIRLYMPFVKVVCTPSCFNRDLGKKQIRFRGYMELASLHPNHFSPNPEVLHGLGLTPKDTFIVVRFVSWQASHDFGQHGIHDKIGLVKALEQHGRVFITSEGSLPKQLDQYKINIPPDKLHDLLYYATLYVGEGATTASECSMLGTHAIYVNTLQLGYIFEEDERYGLVSDFSHRVCTDTTVLLEAKKMLENKNLKKDGKLKMGQIIDENCDVTAFMIWFIENYPNSYLKMKKHPEMQYCSYPFDKLL